MKCIIVHHMFQRHVLDYVSETNHTKTVGDLYIYKGSNFYHCSITAAHGIFLKVGIC